MDITLVFLIIGIIWAFIGDGNKKRAEKRVKESTQVNPNRSESPVQTRTSNRKRSTNPFNQLVDEWKALVEEEVAKGRATGKVNRPMDLSEPRNAAKTNRPERISKATNTKVADTAQVTAFGEGESYEDSIASLEGESLEGMPLEIGMSDEGYFDREMDRVDRDLSSALEQMDATFEQESQQLNKELDKLFAHMDEGGQAFELTASTNTKAKSTAAKLGLTNKSEIKRGILLKEILDKPLAKRG
ncbi:hypothetical protein EF384_01465 [Aerococcus agrisoli]|uniref:Uncharacterized protein n=1 Tax=Aerococcus agrisoli TaxID=2487350 RepID=A0A3N4GN81_9LACT|nr:hypothetical protein [Aerococcus agrisoli]RPA63615.1 hypothetical protein EF384_01465 [Aerococcus agrisoli]